VDGPDIDDARHAGEDIDATIITPGPRKRCGHRGFVGEITMDPAGDSARRPDRLCDRLGFLVPDVGDQDLGAPPVTTAQRSESARTWPLTVTIPEPPHKGRKTKPPATCPLPKVTIIVILPVAERFVQSAGTVLELAREGPASLLSRIATPLGRNLPWRVGLTIDPESIPFNHGEDYSCNCHRRY
jgi:hypothetical protein